MGVDRSPEAAPTRRLTVEGPQEGGQMDEISVTWRRALWGDRTNTMSGLQGRGDPSRSVKVSTG